MAAGGGQLVLNVAIELLTHRVGCVACVEKAGEGGEAAHQVVECLHVADGRRKFRSRARGHVGKPSLVALLECGRLPCRAFEVRGDLRRVVGTVEVGEVPLGQVSKRHGAGRIGGMAGAMAVSGQGDRGHVHSALDGPAALCAGRVCLHWIMGMDGRRQPVNRGRRQAVRDRVDDLFTHAALE